MTSSRPAAVRPLRRDAQRNRELLVAAAAEVFRERGMQAPLEEVARRAGVSIGTLYNRFPRRADLVDAVFIDMVRDSVAAAERALDDPDPWRGLTTQLTRMAELQAADRGYTDVCAYVLPEGTETERIKAHGRTVLERLLARAQQAGAARLDVTVDDIALLSWSAVRATESVRVAAPQAWRRHLALVLDALRAENATPLPQPPLDPAAVRASMRAD